MSKSEVITTTREFISGVYKNIASLNEIYIYKYIYVNIYIYIYSKNLYLIGAMEKQSQFL